MRNFCNDSSCCLGCTYNIFFPMIYLRKDITIALVSFGLCVLNAVFAKYINVYYIKVFFTSFFKDISGATAFCACCNMILGFFGMRVHKFWYIVVFMIFCGLFWEYVTPLYRQTVSDILDVFAYVLGGCVYWLTLRVEKRS